MRTTNGTNPEEELNLSFAVSYILVMLPLSVFILSSGCLRWRQQAAAVSHSDFFTYNMALMELFGVLGQVLGMVFKESDLSFLLSTFPWYAETVFPVYTSVEQYLAAVYPVTYLSLKRGRGLWIRYAGAALVWLLCATKVTLMERIDSREKMLFASDVVEIAALLLVMVFCSSSVLHVLRRPKPGQRSGADRSKQKAFFLLLSVTLVLVFRFTWDLGYTAACLLPKLGKTRQCLILGEVVKWVNLVTSLVTPLMYLQRSRKLLI